MVIAILAAITIVSYNGITQRANNTATVDAAAKVYRMVLAYIALNNAYPKTTNGNACVTIDTGCFGTSVIATDTTFNNNMATIGTVPRTAPKTSDTHYGIYFLYEPDLTFNGASLPMRLSYFLDGANQPCKLDNVTNYAYPAMNSSTTGYTTNNISGSGKTLCWVSIPGPTL